MNLIKIDIRIAEFIAKITNRETTDNVFNQYSNPIQHNNLFFYLNQALQNKVEILLLGEATGFNGCRNSGIPFTATYNVKKSRHFRNLRSSIFLQELKEKREQTSTIFHDFLNKNPDIFKKIVLWNVVPFHPHELTGLETNRTPNKQEIAEGREYLLDLFQIFGFKQYYPIGNIADDSLKELKAENSIIPFDFFKIRHPSHGGKADFIKGMRKIFNIKVKIQTKLAR